MLAHVRPLEREESLDLPEVGETAVVAQIVNLARVAGGAAIEARLENAEALELDLPLLDLGFIDVLRAGARPLNGQDGNGQ